LTVFTYALLLDFMQDSYSMASARENDPHNRIQACQEKWAREVEQVPANDAKIDYYKVTISNLTEQLKLLNKTTGKLCFLGRR